MPALRRAELSRRGVCRKADCDGTAAMAEVSAEPLAKPMDHHLGSRDRGGGRCCAWRLWLDWRAWGERVA